MVLQIVLGILASLITAWFSRHRECRADAGGAHLAGREHMVGALRHLALNRDAVDPRHKALDTMKINGACGLALLFSTHPSLEDRIAALQN